MGAMREAVEHASAERRVHAAPSAAPNPDTRRDQARRRCLLFVSHKVADYGPDSEELNGPFTKRIPTRNDNAFQQ